jgi:hypothetical protein
MMGAINGRIRKTFLRIGVADLDPLGSELFLEAGSGFVLL